MRVSSEKPVKGGGWLHSSSERPVAKSVDVPKLSRPEIQLVYKSAQTAIHPTKLGTLARRLGLSEAALHFMGIGWLDGVRMAKRSGGHCAVSAWCFPMARPVSRDVNQVCGLRLRTMLDEKFSFTGGCEGLFIPSAQDSGVLFVVEGPTSAAALVDLGLKVIGRPNCLGGADDVIRYARVNRCDDLVVVGDNDEEKFRSDGTSFYPGQDGAARLADQLSLEGFSTRVLIPPIRKDVRDWKKAGATREIVLSEIAKLSRWGRRVVA